MSKRFGYHMKSLQINSIQFPEGKLGNAFSISFPEVVCQSRRHARKDNGIFGIFEAPGPLLYNILYSWGVEAAAINKISNDCLSAVGKCRALTMEEEDEK